MAKFPVWQTDYFDLALGSIFGVNDYYLNLIEFMKYGTQVELNKIILMFLSFIEQELLLLNNM